MLVYQAHSLPVRTYIPGRHVSIEGHMRAHDVVALPSQRVEDNHGSAAGDRYFYALGDVSQHIAQDLATSQDREFRVAHRLDEFLPQKIEFHRLDEFLPQKIEFLLGVIGVVQRMIDCGEHLCLPQRVGGRNHQRPHMRKR